MVCAYSPEAKQPTNPVSTLEHLDMVQKTVVSKEYLCDLAQQRGLQRCLSMSQRQENMAAPPNTMKLGLTALVGAVWLDSCDQDTGNMESVKQVMERLG
jgi:dsRNA-specific ribonuclease